MEIGLKLNLKNCFLIPTTANGTNNTKRMDVNLGATISNIKKTPKYALYQFFKVELLSMNCFLVK